MSVNGEKASRLPPNYWRGILVFSVLWLAIGFGAAIAWSHVNAPEKHSARLLVAP